MVQRLLYELIEIALFSCCFLQKFKEIEGGDDSNLHMLIIILIAGSRFFQVSTPIQNQGKTDPLPPQIRNVGTNLVLTLYVTEPSFLSNLKLRHKR